MKSQQLLRFTPLLIAALLVCPGLAGPPKTEAVDSASQKKPHAARSDNKSKWVELFDGRSLKNWKITNFGGEGDVSVEQGEIRMDFGASLTGITYQGDDLPKTNYELELQAKRVDGIDFFCTTTFPVRDSFCSLVVGGWAGSVVGLSSIDDDDASQNETTRYIKFEDNRWYRIRIRVTDERIQAWIDDRPIVDQPLKGHKISTRAEVDISQPLGVCAWETRAALKGIRLRKLDEGELAAAKSD